jgi:hypothetical protein
MVSHHGGLQCSAMSNYDLRHVCHQVQVLLKFATAPAVLLGRGLLLLMACEDLHQLAGPLTACEACPSCALWLLHQRVAAGCWVASLACLSCVRLWLLGRWD